MYVSYLMYFWLLLIHVSMAGYVIIHRKFFSGFGIIPITAGFGEAFIDEMRGVTKFFKAIVNVVYFSI